MGEGKGGGFSTLQGSLYHSSTPLQPYPMNGPFKKEINFPKTQILLQMLGYKKLGFPHR